MIPASTSAAAAGLALGCVALLILGLEPELLGALLEEHRLSVAQLAQAATVEWLAIGAVAATLGGVLSHRYLRRWGIAGCVLLAASNAACLGAHGEIVVLCRALSGVGGGILVWIATGLVTHGRSPGRLSAIFLAAQAGSQGVLAALLPATTMSSGGANGGFAALAVMSLSSVVLLPLLPACLADLPRAQLGHSRLSVPAVAGLAGSFLYMAGIVGLFVFMEPLATAAHITPSVARFAVAWNLAAQLAGCALAAFYSRRFAPLPTIVACCIGVLLSVGGFVSKASDAVFLAATLLFGFLWMFGLPYFVPLMIRLDPTRRSALLLPGTQLLGGAAGPQIIGWFATETHLLPVLVSSAVLVAGSLVSTLIAGSAER